MVYANAVPIVYLLYKRVCVCNIYIYIYIYIHTQNIWRKTANIRKIGIRKIISEDVFEKIVNTFKRAAHYKRDI